MLRVVRLLSLKTIHIAWTILVEEYDMKPSRETPDLRSQIVRDDRNIDVTAFLFHLWLRPFYGHLSKL